MAILTFPNIDPDILDFGIRFNTQISVSEISGIAKTIEIPGARWLGNLSFTTMTPNEIAPLKSFLLQLRGSAGRFYYSDQSHTTPFNAVTGSPTIEAGSTPRFIRVTLGAGSEEFSQGDYIQIGTDTSRELKMVTGSTLVSGTTYDVTLEPLIRRTDYQGLSIVYNNPTGVFMLTSDDQALWSVREKIKLSDITIEFVEAY